MITFKEVLRVKKDGVTLVTVRWPDGMVGGYAFEPFDTPSVIRLRMQQLEEQGRHTREERGKAA